MMVSKGDKHRNCWVFLDITLLDFGRCPKHSSTFNIDFLCGFRRNEDIMTQWQCEFRGQIRALTQWLKNMEMRLPPMESRVSLVFCLDSLLSFLFFQLYILFKNFPTLLSSFFVYTSFKSFGIAAHSWFFSMGHPVVTCQSHSYPIIRAITPSNKITAKFKSTRR